MTGRARSSTARRKGACELEFLGALDAHAHGRPPGGGAARFESPERDRRRQIAAAGGKLRRFCDTEGKGEGEKAREEA